jgi:hypothetical protein
VYKTFYKISIYKMENLYLAVSDVSGNVWLTRVDQNTGNTIGILYKILTPPVNFSYSVLGMTYDKKMDTMYLSILVSNTSSPVPPTWSLFAINKFSRDICHLHAFLPQSILTSNILIRGIAYNKNTIYGINNSNIVYLIDVCDPNLNNSITLTSTSSNFGSSINLAIFDNTLYTFEMPNQITALFSFDLNGNNGDNKQIIGYPNNYNYSFSPPGICSLTANKDEELYGVYTNTIICSPGYMFLAKYDKSSPFIIKQISHSPIINDVNFQGNVGALAFVSSSSFSSSSSSCKHKCKKCCNSKR